MPNQDKINEVSEQVTAILDKAKLELTEDLLKLRDKVTPDEFIQALEKMDLKAILDAKISKAKQLYIQQHKVVLEEIIPFGDLDANRWTNIRIILSGNISVLDEIIGTDASELKNILNSATISGMQTSEILNQVSVASSASGQRAILNTRLNTYSRVATNTMMKDAPADTKYVYVGPIDDRTRDECLEYASAGPLTEAQIIESRWSASLVYGGGINWRHKW